MSFFPIILFSIENELWMHLFISMLIYNWLSLIIFFINKISFNQFFTVNALTMKFQITILYLLFVVTTSYSQDKLLEQDINLRSYLSDKREVYPVVDTINNKIVLFLIDNDTINAQVYDNEYKFINSYKCPRPSGKYKILIGSTIDSGSYYLYFSNNRKKEFLVKSLNVDNSTSTERKLDFKLKNEEYIESIDYMNDLYVLTRTKLPSIYKIRLFKADKLVTCKELDLSEVINNEMIPNKFADELYDDVESEPKFDFQRIKIENPNPLDLTSNDSKIYCYNHNIVLSLDKEENETSLIFINLNDYTVVNKKFKHGDFRIKNNQRTLSNSYIYNDQLYQLKISKSELCFTVHCIKTNSLIKQYYANSEEDINFKNTPLILRKDIGGKDFTERNLGKTKQILKKLITGAIGISVYPIGDKLEVQLGGIKECYPTGNMLIAGLSGAIGGAIISGGRYIYVPDYTMYSYSNYANSRSVYFKCLLNNRNLNYIPGKIGLNPFDKIKQFVIKNKIPATTQTIFKIDNYFVFGYYSDKSKKYYLHKFE